MGTRAHVCSGGTGARAGEGQREKSDPHHGHHFLPLQIPSAPHPPPRAPIAPHLPPPAHALKPLLPHRTPPAVTTRPGCPLTIAISPRPLLTDTIFPSAVPHTSRAASHHALRGGPTTSYI